MNQQEVIFIKSQYTVFFKTTQAGKPKQMPISKNITLVIALVVVASALTAITFATLNPSQSIPSSGTVTTSPSLGVYSDSGCTLNMTSISWGSVAAGDSVTQTFYVKNIGTGTMTLGLAISNWSPSNAGTYLTVSWNQQGTQLTAGESTAATITLTVSSTVSGFSSFSNTIAITGTSS